jgi:hypothetical protein
MVSVMADNDVAGHFDELLRLLSSDEWRDIWDDLGVGVESFEGLGLVRDAPDRLVWQTCQERQVILFTGNRNQESAESLEATIRALNQADSLPVLTLADPDRFRRSRAYAERVAERFPDCLMNIQHHRGAGRLYLL